MLTIIEDKYAFGSPKGGSEARTLVQVVCLGNDAGKHKEKVEKWGGGR